MTHFIVLCDRGRVGRIFDRVPSASALRNATWCWTIDGKYRVGAGPDGAWRACFDAHWPGS
jgi:hypothetical protein